VKPVINQGFITKLLFEIKLGSVKVEKDCQPKLFFGDLRIVIVKHPSASAKPVKNQGLIISFIECFVIKLTP
jgi:hypothetical protein